MDKFCRSAPNNQNSFSSKFSKTQILRVNMMTKIISDILHFVSNFGKSWEKSMKMCRIYRNSVIRDW